MRYVESGIIYKNIGASDGECAADRIFVLVSFLRIGDGVCVMPYEITGAGKRDLFPAADGIQGGEMR